MNNFIKFFYIGLIVLTGFGLVFASGWHIADEIFSGTFNGSYNFINGKVNVGTVNNEGLLTIKHTGSSFGHGFRLIPSDTDANYWEQLVTTDDSLRIGYSGFTQVIIESSGDVGIGTNSPIAKLSVNGNITAESICDETGNNCQDLSSVSSGSIPSGAIMAFYLTTCPSGWKPADGTSSTPDLRGVFLRGMETFNAGSSYNNRDPDRSGAGTLGNYQADEYEAHGHSLGRKVNSNGEGTQYTGLQQSSGNNIANPAYSSNSGGSETRPKNVAVLYCVKN